MIKPAVSMASMDTGRYEMGNSAQHEQAVEHIRPQMIWVSCGNTSNARLRQIFEALFPQAPLLIQGRAALVEITDIP